MSDKKYYSARFGKNPEMNLSIFQRLFFNAYKTLEEIGLWKHTKNVIFDKYSYFVENLGQLILTKLHRHNLYPIEWFYTTYKEEDIFDLIELLYDCSSLPCKPSEDGKPYSVEVGNHFFNLHINKILNEYKQGYQLNEQGQILKIPSKEFEKLLKVDSLFTLDKKNIEDRIKYAINKFFHYSLSNDEKKEAVRVLIDVLEFMKPQLKEILTEKDESDLFNIANNFGLRHHKQSQQTKYDPDIWYEWMFYYYLNTAQTVKKLIEKRQPLIQPLTNLIELPITYRKKTRSKRRSRLKKSNISTKKNT